MQSTIVEREITAQTNPRPRDTTPERRSLPQIRANYYGKLGIKSRQSNKRTLPTASKKGVLSEQIENTRSAAYPQHQLAEQDDKATAKSCLKQIRSALHPKQRNQVKFCGYMHVHLIPSHRDYDIPTKEALWNSSRVLKEERKRNELEFYFEGGDWRAAVEEQDMVRMPDGFLVHPATWAYLQAFYQGHVDAYYEYTEDREWNGEHEEEKFEWDEEAYGAEEGEREEEDKEQEVPPEEFAYRAAYQYEGYFQTKPLPSYHATVKPCRRNSWDKSAKSQSRSVLSDGTQYYTASGGFAMYDSSHREAVAA